MFFRSAGFFTASLKSFGAATPTGPWGSRAARRFWGFMRSMKNTSGCRFFLRCLCGCGIITALEFFVGLLVNKIFRLHVWDYSHLPFNIFGQICPLFSFAWFLLSFPACHLCDGVQMLLFRAALRKNTL